MFTEVAQLTHIQGPWLKYKGHLTNISENLRTSLRTLSTFRSDYYLQLSRCVAQAAISKYDINLTTNAGCER